MDYDNAVALKLSSRPVATHHDDQKPTSPQGQNSHISILDCMVWMLGVSDTDSHG